MASILKVDEMQGVTSAGDITITGEGGSATMQLQQGWRKRGPTLMVTAGTLAFADSFNAHQLRQTGRQVLYWTNSMTWQRLRIVQIPG